MDCEAVRRRLLTDHQSILAGILAGADAVATAWPPGGTTDQAAVAGPLADILERDGLHARLPAVLSDAGNALGTSLLAQPVAAPPYVVITSKGPVLRGPVPGRRVILTVAVFRVERDPVRYVRGPTSPAAALSVELRE